MRIRKILISLIFLGFLSAAYGQSDEARVFDKESVLKDVENFFGKGSIEIGKVMEKVFSEHGLPNAVIRGQEGGASLAVGVRYGNGILEFRNGTKRSVHWAGPSIGFDTGANASKVYVLVYKLPNAESIFNTFHGVEGSAYMVGGVGVTYQKNNDIVLAPLRLGVGFRLGAAVGYTRYTRKKSWNPF